ncbi:PIG-L family deacetylase [Candidatus Bathyarchaeota archaeon]|nr:PIG-L family deacetylase [Candidatus Bathyarchaeota archaeon]MBS7618659.1 PIG-L family deacetylase [Candidatus Bathyarchaeota archaeon]
MVIYKSISHIYNLSAMNFSDLELKDVKRLLLPNLENVFEKCNTVLSIQPHPDDTDIAAGGTIAKLARNSCQVIYVTVTDGGAGTSVRNLSWESVASIRRREQESAAKILRVSELIWLNYRDSELEPTMELRSRLITLIRRFKPDIVLTVDPWLRYEAHPDHRATGIAVSEAFLLSGFPNVNHVDLVNGLEPHSPKFIAYYWSERPNVYIDITEWIDIKFKAIMEHASQLSDGMVSLLKGVFRLMGGKAGYEYAEAFKVLTSSALHCDIYASEL